MKSKEHKYIILPGQSGWELWQSASDGGFEPHFAQAAASPQELGSIAAGELLMCMPVESLTFAPFVVNSADSELFEDIVAAHLESHNISVDQQGGVLCDFYRSVDEAESSTLLAPFVLAPQSEQQLPKRPPHHFDCYGALFCPQDKQLVLRRELGSWVLYLYNAGILVYAQIIGAKLDAAGLREIKLVLGQLAFQGLQWDDLNATLWLPRSAVEAKEAANRAKAVEESAANAPEDAESSEAKAPAAATNAGEVLSRSEALALAELVSSKLGFAVEVQEEPALVWPQKFSRLLPADVGAERRRRLQKQRRTLIGVVLGVLVLALAGWFFVKNYRQQQQIAELQRELKSLEPDVERLLYLQRNYRSLGAVVDAKMRPEEILLRLQRCITAGDVRFKQFSISSDNAGILNEISFIGESRNNTSVTGFIKKVQVELPNYRWSFGNPSEKNGVYEFDASAQPADQISTQ